MTHKIKGHTNPQTNELAGLAIEVGSFTYTETDVGPLFVEVCQFLASMTRTREQWCHSRRGRSSLGQMVLAVALGPCSIFLTKVS